MVIIAGLKKYNLLLLLFSSGYPLAQTQYLSYVRVVHSYLQLTQGGAWPEMRY